jgi:hypothetical protein
VRTFLTLILINSFALFAQTNKLDTTLLTIPDGYIISYFMNDKDTATGDFNLDGVKDILVVIMNKDESFDTIRPILLFEGKKEGGYTLVAKNNKLWCCEGGCDYHTCHGHILEIDRANNYFSIMHWGCFYTTNDSTHDVTGYKEWQRVTKFKYNATKKEYLLHEDIRSEHPGCGECIDVKHTYKKYNKDQWNKIKFKDYVVSDVF